MCMMYAYFMCTYVYMVAVIPCAPQAGVVAEGAMETPEPPRAGGCWSAGSMPRGRD